MRDQAKPNRLMGQKKTKRTNIVYTVICVQPHCPATGPIGRSEPLKFVLDVYLLFLPIHLSIHPSMQVCNFTIDYEGPKIPFDEDGVWPMVRNPKMNMFAPGSRAHFHAEIFNKAYTKLIKALEKAFNGKPEELGNALGLMFSVELHLKNLVRTPIDDNGNPEVGPNAGPTFTFTPE